MRVKITAAVGLLLSCAVVGIVLWPTTTRYVSNEGGYAVTFPARVEVRTKSQNVGGLRQNFATVEQGKTSHVVMHMALPPNTLEKTPAASILDGAVKGSLRRSDGKVASQKDFDFGPEKHPAREVVVDLPDGTSMKLHAVVTNASVYVLVVGGPRGYGRSPAAAEFLGSFELVK